MLCAGLGTRLRPLTDELPKPLVPVGDRSLLGHALHGFAAAGLDSAVINTHHLPERFVDSLERWPLPVTRVHEPVIRGTAGALAGARPFLTDAPVIVQNGDILVTPPVQALLEAARGSGGLVLAVARAQGRGTVGLDERGRVTRVRGESFGLEATAADYVGVAALGPTALAAVPEMGCLIGDLALPLLRHGEPIHTVPVEGPWTDAGDPAAYLQANLDWLKRSARTHWCAPSAAVAPGVTLQDSVIGAGAIVGGMGALIRTIVWPGARVTAPLADCVVTRAGRVLPITAR